jgi:hypothetical protein
MCRNFLVTGGFLYEFLGPQGGILYAFSDQKRPLVFSNIFFIINGFTNDFKEARKNFDLYFFNNKK